MIIVLARAIYWMGNIFTYALFGRAILSWFARASYNGGNVIVRVYDVLVRFTEPIVSPVREFLSRHFRTGMFDWSIFATMILVELVVQVIVRGLLFLA